MLYRTLTHPLEELPFCSSTENKTMELACLENGTGLHIVITVQDTLLRFGLPPGGKFYCVLCDGAYVSSFQRVFCGYERFYINDGANIRNYDSEKECFGTWSAKAEPVQKGALTLYPDDTFSVMGYRMKTSPHGNPIVYVRDGVAVDAEGNLMVQEQRCYRGLLERPYILGDDNGGICVTDQRKAAIRGGTALEQVIDVKHNYFCYLALTRTGEVYVSFGPNEWVWVCNHATAMTSHASHVAIAKDDGTIVIYEEGRNNDLVPAAELVFPHRHITEMDMCKNNLAILFDDSHWTVRDWTTGDGVDYLDGYYDNSVGSAVSFNFARCCTNADGEQESQLK